MANLAIKGHPTRGKEVIQILEMLGGHNNRWDCTHPDWFYFIINGAIYTNDIQNKEGYQIYTLEDFLEKFPYKVGDEVTHSDYEFPLEIVGMKWENNSIMYEVYTNDYGYWFCIDELKPYKEETFGECIEKTINECLFGKKETMEEQIKIDIPKGYKFACVDNDNRQVAFEKTTCQYPKIYDECCDVLELDDDERYINVNITNIETLENKKFEAFIRLIRCRDAYWKLAGEEMGLGKPWEPDWNNLSTTHEFIKINKGCFTYSSRVLVFPTEEMRDTFYENFKSLIEECKELL